MASSIGTLLILVALIGATSASDCIEMFIVTAMTSDETNAGSDTDFILDVTYKTGLFGDETAIYSLHNLPGNDMEQNDGDTWYLKQSAVGVCIEPEDVVSLEIKPASCGVDILFDGWNIETAQIFAKTTFGDIVLLCIADKVDKWIDYRVIIPHTLKMERENVATCPKAMHSCIKRVLIYATTSGSFLAGTNGDISINLGYYGRNSTVKLYDRPGNDFERNKGDLWYYNINQFYSESCVIFSGIDKVQLIADTIDGWIVSDVYVSADLKDSDKYALLAAGYPMESLVDGDEGPGYVNVPLHNNC